MVRTSALCVFGLLFPEQNCALRLARTDGVIMQAESCHCLNRSPTGWSRSLEHVSTIGVLKIANLGFQDVIIVGELDDILAILHKVMQDLNRVAFGIGFIPNITLLGIGGSKYVFTKRCTPCAQHSWKYIDRIFSRRAFHAFL